MAWRGVVGGGVSRRWPPVELEPFAARLAGQAVVFGRHSVTRIGELASELLLRAAAEGRGGAPDEPKRALLVTDPGVARAGHVDRVASVLVEAGFTPTIYAEVAENPTTADAERCRDAAAACGGPEGATLDLVVAVGGGSVMDVAKAANLLLTNHGRVEDYWGFGKVRRPLRPALAVPTTAGTGSEAQSYAVIAQQQGHRKMAIGDFALRFSTVVLDPALLTSAPRSVRALAAIDALSHAVESYVSTARNPLSEMFAGQAWCLLDGALAASLEDGDSVVATASQGRDPLAATLLGAHFAGHAIEASMLGAAHAAANPLTAQFGVAHGAAVGLMLPAVVRFNAAEPPHVDGNGRAGLSSDARYGELLAAVGRVGAGRELASRIAELRAVAGLPGSLGALGVPLSACQELAAAAAEQWTGRFNPRPVDREAFLELYGAVN